MFSLHEPVVLYHGSFCEVTAPDLERCARYKDFGKGFYLTTDLAQAEAFAKITVRKSIANGTVAHAQNYGIVSHFEYTPQELKVHLFPTSDTNWLHCIVAHRMSGAFQDLIGIYSQYDVIGGKIANDATNITLTNYMTGAYGVMGTKTADDFCIGLLLPERLKDQYCFRTTKALAQLRFLKSTRVWM